jgi:hypothetical protein
MQGGRIISFGLINHKRIVFIGRAIKKIFFKRIYELFEIDSRTEEAFDHLDKLMR